MVDQTDKHVPDFSDIKKEELMEIMKQKGIQVNKYLEETHNDGLNTIIRKLHTSTKKGVLGFDDELEHRRLIFGSNSLPLDPPKHFFHFLLFAMRDWILIVLAIGALLSLILGLVFPEKCDEKVKIVVAWYEGIGILGMVIAMMVISALSDYLRDSDFRYQDNKVKHEQKVLVVRGGDIKEIYRTNLTVGDLCVIEAGSVIPGDGILVQSSDLIVNEMCLETGGIVEKDPTGDLLLYAATHVTQGSGRFIVLAIGQFTKAAQAGTKGMAGKPPSKLEIAIPSEDHQSHDNISLLQKHKEDNATLQGKINRVAVTLGYIGVIIAIITMVVIIIRFSVYTYSTRKQQFYPGHINEYVRAFIMGMVVLVVSVPEGLPLTVTFALAFCTRMMYKNQSLVRHTDIIETMGNITNVCCNKTGVLTEHRMQVTKLYTAGQVLEGDPRNYKDRIPSNLFEELYKGIAINTSYTSRILVIDFYIICCQPIHPSTLQSIPPLAYLHYLFHSLPSFLPSIQSYPFILHFSII